MRIIEDPDAMQQWALAEHRGGKSIGFVPTMGALHEGHLSLVRRCRVENDWCVVSIFVNPLQFGPNEDLDTYPRGLERDQVLLQKENADVVFLPTPQTMYPPGFSMRVEEKMLSKVLCGASRPGHFAGVTTVVLKLLNLVQPVRAYFGQKDAQQARIIQQMVRDLAVPVETVVLPIVREPDGLAMSSRNAYLTPEQRAEAPVLFQALEWARKAVDTGERSADTLCLGIRERISATSARIDYVSVVDFETLRDVPVVRGAVLIAVAVFFGTTRLIDNVIVQSD
ncbi:MAG: pantoate--beta-alanine ligase [Verrucomicrobia bacterium]|nr:pantoate--beta-alanine ligase [Verrucomicrobiota bacterium]